MSRKRRAGSNYLYLPCGTIVGLLGRHAHKAPSAEKQSDVLTWTLIGLIPEWHHLQFSHEVFSRRDFNRVVLAVHVTASIGSAQLIPAKLQTFWRQVVKGFQNTHTHIHMQIKNDLSEVIAFRPGHCSLSE